MRDDVGTLREEVRAMLNALKSMATKDDIDAFARKLAGYATHDDIRVLRHEIDAVRLKVEVSSLESTVERWSRWAQRLTAIAAFAGASLLLLIHLLERLK